MVRKKSDKNNTEDNILSEIGTGEKEAISKEESKETKVENKSFEPINFKLNEIINNEIIKEIQLALRELGYNTSVLGDYDNITYGAVCDYKRKNKYKEVNGDINERLYKDLIVDKVRE